MCGIFGIWNFKNTRGSNLLEASRLLRHRGPDDEGFLAIGQDGFKHYGGSDSTNKNLQKLSPTISIESALLHRRLAILDLSEAGHQPMTHTSEKIHLVFNGEIYNYRSLIQTYALNVKTGTDTEMILLLYAKIGVEAFSKFRGMWALSILDLEQNKLILSRDRFGIKPLYFTHQNGGLAFSSEIKPLLSLPGMESKWERKRFLQFVVFGATSDPHETFFKGIEALAPGRFREYNLDTLSFSETEYYNLRQSVSQYDSTNKDFESLFHESIADHLIADVEIGSCLSGGLDSSLIVAEAARQSRSGFQTFTCSFPGEAIDESAYARRLAQGTRRLEQHFITPTASDFFEGFDSLIRSQERPFGSASIFAQQSVMRLASDNGIKVLLDGQGADEILGGYYPYAGAHLLSILKSGKIKAYQREIRALKKHFNSKMETAMLRSAFYTLPQKVQVLARKQNRLGYNLIRADIRAEAQRLQSPKRGAVHAVELGFRSVEFGLYELLHYEDRNAMSYSIESRVPFLDHRIVEWALAQPSHIKIRDGWTKYPIRESLEKHDLGQLAWRTDKLGFVAPQKRWREELSQELSTSIAQMEIPDIFDKKRLAGLFSAGVTGNSAQSEFWRIYALIRWMEVFKVELV